MGEKKKKGGGPPQKNPRFGSPYPFRGQQIEKKVVFEFGRDFRFEHDRFRWARLLCGSA